MRASATAAASETPRRDITDYATVEAHCNGVPVYAFGYTYVHGVSPDLQPSVKLQQGNNRPWRKILPKKSWEIKSNKFGSTPAREPRTARNDDQPLLSIHLIDGDSKTAWCSRGQIQPDVEPEWIRIDLPVESVIQSVVLLPHPEGMGQTAASIAQIGRLGSEGLVGQAFPRHLEIKVSRDAWHWETVYENDNFPTPNPMGPQEFAFSPRLAKQIWIVAKEFPTVQNFGHCFSLGEVEVRDGEGNDLALISRGAGVTVSSTHTGYGMDRFTQDMLWPIQYDLGFKWSRVGYDMGMFTWAYVEREKGKLEVDPRADAAVAEAVKNGINMIMCLDKGNWLHAPHPKKKDRTRELMEVYYDAPPEPTVDNPEYFQAWLEYVRFMVRHFKDRIRYYEIWNGWHRSLSEYVQLAKATIPVIRREYPEAKILPNSLDGFDREKLTTYLKQGLGSLIDVLAWRPWYNVDPTSPRFVTYPDDVREFKKQCEYSGFKGEYIATESTWIDPYPPDESAFRVSELQKAKYALRLNVMHAGLDVVSLWNETFQEEMVAWAIGLNRNAFNADPIPPTQPEAVYYVFRTLCTVLEESKPAEFALGYRPAGKCQSWTFERVGGEKLLTFWKGDRAKDISDVQITDVILVGQRVKTAIGIDLLNGREQELEVTQLGTDSLLKGMLLQDFPAVVRFTV